MGYVVNDYIIVTGAIAGDLELAHANAVNLFKGKATPIFRHEINHGGTFFIVSSGSKEGWEEQEKHTSAIKVFLGWLRAKNFYLDIAFIQMPEELEKTKIVELIDHKEGGHDARA